MADSVDIAPPNTVLRQSQTAYVAAFPREQGRIYSYDGEAVLRS